MNRRRYPKSIWSYNPLPSGCVLYIPFWHPNLAGNAFRTIDGNNTATVTTATYTVNGRSFTPGTPDYVELAAETLMNFTTGAFSVVARINIDDLTDRRTIIARGLDGADGFNFFVFTNGRIQINTNAVAGDDVSFSGAGAVTTGSDFTIGFTRSGTSVIPYVNGAAAVSTAGVHETIQSSARTVKLGIQDGKVLFPFSNLYHTIMVHEIALSASDHLHAHNILSQQ